MLFIDILLLFLYKVDSYKSTSRIYGSLTSLGKLLKFNNLDMLIHQVISTAKIILAVICIYFVNT